MLLCGFLEAHALKQGKGKVVLYLWGNYDVWNSSLQVSDGAGISKLRGTNNNQYYQNVNDK